MVNEWSGVRVQPLARDCGMRIAIAAAMLLWAGDANAQVANGLARARRDAAARLDDGHG